MTSTVQDAVTFLAGKSDFTPTVGIVLGSGFGALADLVEGISVPYSDIPGFKKSTVPNHRGVLHLGTLFGHDVAVLQGRIHMYEDYSAADVAFPTKVLCALGIDQLILTNAAGGINTGLNVGDFVAIEDHLSIANMAGLNPLRGPMHGSDGDTAGDRFVSMNGAYDTEMLEGLMKTGEGLDIEIKRGGYGFVVGPSFETPLEIRLLASVGCDLVGMSTVPEVLVARRAGIRVVALSAVTNMSVHSVSDSHITNEQEVWETMKTVEARFLTLMEAYLASSIFAGSAA